MCGKIMDALWRRYLHVQLFHVSAVWFCGIVVLIDTRKYMTEGEMTGMTHEAMIKIVGGSRGIIHEGIRFFWYSK
jgi:hypothetical protein